MHLGILAADIENGRHWPWPSRSFGHFDFWHWPSLLYTDLVRPRGVARPKHALVPWCKSVLTAMPWFFWEDVRILAQMEGKMKILVFLCIYPNMSSLGKQALVLFRTTNICQKIMQAVVMNCMSILLISFCINFLIVPIHDEESYIAGTTWLGFTTKCHEYVPLVADPC